MWDNKSMTAQDIFFRSPRVRRSAFTLIELLVVIAIIAILAVVVVLTLNPAQLLAQSRDANRVSDLQTLSSAISLYQADQSGAPSFSMGSSSVVYASTPDPAASSTCGASGMLTLPSGYAWHCASSSGYKNASSSGWLPINFNEISSGAPFGSLPADPTNSTSSRLFYTYTTNGSQFELTAPMESQKYQLGGSGDVIGGDGAPLATVYAKGTNLTLEPLDYGDPTLVGYWPLNEGTGAVAYDDSGSGVNGAWIGAASGTQGYYVPGVRQTWAGYFNGSSTAASTSLAMTTGLYTVSVWVYPGMNTGTDEDITYSGPRIIYSPWRTSGLYVVSGATAPNGYYLSTSTWSMVTAVYDGKTSWIYVNGIAVGSTTASPITTGITVIGAANLYSSGNQGFNGAIEDLRAYNRALTSAQVAALYNSGK